MKDPLDPEVWWGCTTMKEFIAYSRELNHRRQYEEALHFAGVMSPDWDELTEAKRAEIRIANKWYWAEMADFGRALATEPA